MHAGGRLYCVLDVACSCSPCLPLTQARDVVAQRTADVKAAQEAAQSAKAEAQKVAQAESKEREKRAAEAEGRKVAAAARNKAVQVCVDGGGDSARGSAWAGGCETSLHGETLLLNQSH
jgi:membrane protein involved in colicin uptake